jgi:hypothetical protein
VVRFRIPVKNGGSIQEVDATPARVTMNNTASPPAAHNRMVLLGSNLSGGRSRSLVLKNTIWSTLPAPNGPVDQTVVDLSINPSWTVDFQPDRITVQLAPLLQHVRPNGVTVALPLLPGFYTVLERTVVDEQIVSGDLKQIVASSNEVSFAVAPRIDSHTPPDGAGNIRIDLGSEFNPLDPNLPADAIQVIVEGEVYTRVNADPPANAREFFVTNSPTNFVRIRPHFPVVVTKPQAHAFRIVVNGAESAPFWIELS